MHPSKISSFFLTAISGIIISCNQHANENKKTEKDIKPVVEAVRTDTVQHNSILSTITYHYLPLDSFLITQLKDKFSPENLKLILALNRVDFEHVWKLDTLVVPDTFIEDLKMYSPFPDRLSLITDIPKLIFFSYYSQMFAAYEHGNLVRWGPTSMGKRSTPTPTGLYFTNWKAKQTISTENPEWKLNWYFNLDNARGVSLHQYDLPGFPASHACLRLYEEDAHWFYDWAEQWILIDDHNIDAYGTPVIIFGTYPFGKRKPWLQLPVNNLATHYNEEELNKEIENFLPVIKEKKSERDSVIFARKNAPI